MKLNLSKLKLPMEWKAFAQVCVFLLLIALIADRGGQVYITASFEWQLSHLEEVSEDTRRRTIEQVLNSSFYPMQKDASAIITKVGSYTVWQNGTDATLKEYDTDASKIISWAFGNLTSGRIWKEKVILKGNFTLDSIITLPSYAIVELQGKITRTDSPQGMFKTVESEGIKFFEWHGGFLDANGLVSYPILSFRGNEIACHDVIVENVHFYDSYNGINFEQVSSGKYAYNLWITKCLFEKIQNSAIEGTRAKYNWITENKFIECGTSVVGVLNYCTYSSSIYWLYNEFYDCGDDQTDPMMSDTDDSCHSFVIVGNKLTESASALLLQLLGMNHIVSHNSVWNCTPNNAYSITVPSGYTQRGIVISHNNLYSSIWVYGANNITVSHNYCEQRLYMKDLTESSISFNTANDRAYFNNVTNSTVSYNTSPLWQISGSSFSGTRWQGDGFDQTGTAIISSSTSTTFAHNLLGQLDYLWASFNSTAYNGYTWSANTTHAIITVGTSGDYTVYWRGIYEP